MTSPTPPTAPAPRRFPWRALALVVLVFFLGAIAGLGGGALWLRNRVRHGLITSTMGRGPIDYLAADFSRSLARDLSLSPEERRAVDAEIQTTARDLKNLRREFTGRAQERVVEAASRVEQALPAEKRPLLRERLQKRLGPWGVRLNPARTE